MPATRLQLTMFLHGAAASRIEAVRRVVDPVQHELIAAHVTLCREDELGALAHIEALLAQDAFEPLLLIFDRVEPFHGHGLLLACTRGAAEFRALRERLLQRPDLRDAQPHVTLAHPRNPQAAGNRPGAASALALPIAAMLSRVSVIEQEAGRPWHTLRTHEFAPHA